MTFSSDLPPTLAGKSPIYMIGNMSSYVDEGGKKGIQIISIDLAARDTLVTEDQSILGAYDQMTANNSFKS